MIVSQVFKNDNSKVVLGDVMEGDNISGFDLINPSESHLMLREMVRDFAEQNVESQALEYDREEKFNLPLFKSLGELGLLGITVSEKYGGSGMDTGKGIAFMSGKFTGT